MRNSIDKKVFSKRMDELMTENNISNVDMAIKLYGYTEKKKYEKVHKWRYGVNAPSANEIPKIAEILRLF